MAVQPYMYKETKPHIYRFNRHWFCSRTTWFHGQPRAQLGVARASPQEAYEASRKLYNW